MKRKRKRWCLKCGDKHAKNLNKLLPNMTFADEPVFCSVRCAAAYGLKLALDRAGFCDEHWLWYDPMDDGCPQCNETPCERY